MSLLFFFKYSAREYNMHLSFCQTNLNDSKCKLFHPIFELGTPIPFQSTMTDVHSLGLVISLNERKTLYFKPEDCRSEESVILRSTILLLPAHPKKIMADPTQALTNINKLCNYSSCLYIEILTIRMSFAKGQSHLSF